MSSQEDKYEAQNIDDSTEETDDAFDTVTIPVPSEEPEESDQTEEHESGLEQFNESRAHESGLERFNESRAHESGLEQINESRAHESGLEQFNESRAMHVEEQSAQSFSSMEPDNEQLMEEVISPRQASCTPLYHERQFAMQSPNHDSLAFLDKIKAIKESLHESKEDSLATVKVVLTPVGQEIVMPFKVDIILKHLKDHFSHLLGIPHSILQIRYSGIDQYQQVPVEIVRSDFHKPFLGGFRHKITGVEYHNAGTQTIPRKIPERPNVFCRDTQTVFEKKKLQQTTNTASTQMTNIGVYVSNMTDKLVTPGKYFPAAEYHAQRLKAAIVIQTYFRQWHAKTFVENVRRQKSLRLEWERQEEVRKIREKEEWIKLDYDRRHNPKTNEDFEFLYNALEFWRQEELKRINQSFTGAERKAALCELLEKEAQIIASIGRHRDIAYMATQEAAIQAFLDKEHECKLTQEILELIDREVDLMMRGVKHHNLEGLRKRIATLFFHYIKTPLFNPQVAKYLKVPQDPLKFYKKIYFCHSCQLYLPSTEFSVSSTSRRIYRCRNCISLENEAQKRESFLKYKCLLQQLYYTEADYEDDSKIAFLMQLQDIQYLTENIWASQSVLSAWDNLSDLAMVRWNKSLEWSPWNCILLTKDEAAAHLKLTSIEEGYEPSFIHKIKHKHILAKNYFSQIPVLASFILDDGEIDEIRQKYRSDTTPKIIESQRPPP
ncbi:IQ motif and ubiquitin-like domain-containing protein isoform X4 [Callithrix jacchus]